MNKKTGPPQHFGLSLDKVSYLLERKVLGLMQAKNYDLTFTELIFLMKIIELEAARPADLVPETLRDKSVVTRLTKKMKDKGYIKFTDDILDRRSYRLSTTLKGKRLFEYMKTNMQPFRQNF